MDVNLDGIVDGRDVDLMAGVLDGTAAFLFLPSILPVWVLVTQPLRQVALNDSRCLLRVTVVMQPVLPSATISFIFTANVSDPSIAAQFNATFGNGSSLVIIVNWSHFQGLAIMQGTAINSTSFAASFPSTFTSPFGVSVAVTTSLAGPLLFARQPLGVSTVQLTLPDQSSSLHCRNHLTPATVVSVGAIVPLVIDSSQLSTAACRLGRAPYGACVDTTNPHSRRHHVVSCFFGDSRGGDVERPSGCPAWAGAVQRGMAQRPGPGCRAHADQR
jgi:hypothetical protein